MHFISVKMYKFRRIGKLIGINERVAPPLQKEAPEWVQGERFVLRVNMHPE